MTKDELLKLVTVLQAELEATNRQVEILSDVLAESRRQVAAPVQEPLEEEWIAYCWNKSLIGHRISYVQYLEFVREVERAHGIKEKNT